MPNITKKHNFNYYFGRASAKDAIEGWDEATIMALPPKERHYILQFLLEYSGQASKPVIDQDLTRHGWRTKRKYYLDAFTNSVPLEDEGESDSLTPIPPKVEDTDDRIDTKPKVKKRRSSNNNDGTNPSIQRSGASPKG
jgi:hypothetical protein